MKTPTYQRDVFTGILKYSHNQHRCTCLQIFLNRSSDEYKKTDKSYKISEKNDLLSVISINSL